MKENRKVYFLVVSLFFVVLICLHLSSEENYFSVDKKINHGVVLKKAGKNRDYKKLLEISKKYNLVFCIRKFRIGYRGKTQSVRRFMGQYRWKFLTDRDDFVLDKYVESLANNWDVFPTEFIQKSGLKSIAFVKDLCFAGIRVGGGFEVTDSIIFVSLPGRFYSTELALYITYHEFFHLLQNRYPLSHEFIDYRKWRSLNAPGVKYYPGGALAMLRKYKGRPGFFHKKPDIKGFVTQYGRTDFYHDPTEIFCCLFVKKRYLNLRKWMKSDAYLRAKVNYLLESLNRISPVFSLEYFDRIHEI